MQVETIFFDAGNTLILANMQMVSDVLADLGCPVDPARLRKAEEKGRLAVDTPEIINSTRDVQRWTTYFKAILKEAGVADNAPVEEAIVRLCELHERENIWSHIYPEAPPALERLRLAGINLAIVSNADGRIANRMAELGVADFFTDIIDSFFVGVEKPDPRIFQIALERTGADSEATLYVGDFYHIDVVGSRKAGLTAVLVDPAGIHADKDVPRIRTLADLEPLLPTL